MAAALSGRRCIRTGKRRREAAGEKYTITSLSYFCADLSAEVRWLNACGCACVRNLGGCGRGGCRLQRSTTELSVTHRLCPTHLLLPTCTTRVSDDNRRHGKCTPTSAWNVHHQSTWWSTMGVRRWMLQRRRAGLVAVGAAPRATSGTWLGEDSPGACVARGVRSCLAIYIGPAGRRVCSLRRPRLDCSPRLGGASPARRQTSADRGCTGPDIGAPARGGGRWPRPRKPPRESDPPTSKPRDVCHRGTTFNF